MPGGGQSAGHPANSDGKVAFAAKPFLVATSGGVHLEYVLNRDASKHAITIGGQKARFYVNKHAGAGHYRRTARSVGHGIPSTHVPRRSPARGASSSGLPTVPPRARNSGGMARRHDDVDGQGEVVVECAAGEVAVGVGVAQLADSEVQRVGQAGVAMGLVRR